MTDGGGEFRAALRTIVGREKVTRFYLAVAETNVVARQRHLNGMPALVFDVTAPHQHQAPRYVVSAALNRDGKISAIYVVSATPKLSAVK
jgi:hypothetical protein